MIVAFTGHRPQKLGGFNNGTNLCKPIMEAIHQAIKGLYKPVSLIISGMALGVDTWAAEYAVAANIPFAAYIPFIGQEKAWPIESQLVYFELLRKAKEVKYICTPGYAAWKMQERNQAMVNDCDILFAVWDGTSGGTSNCITYARSKGKEINIIHNGTH